MSLLGLALAAEIGANAPDHLKDCDKPVIERQAKPGDPNYSRLVHLRRIKTDCGEIRPLSVLFPKESPLAYVSTPEAPAFGVPVNSEQASPQAAQDEVPGQETFAYGGPYGGSFAAFGPIALVDVDARLRAAVTPPVPEPRSAWLFSAGLAALAVWRKAR